MSLFEEDFDIDYDLGNEDGVEFGDIFYLNYYGINVFFYVCGLDHHRVRIYELAKKRGVIGGIHVEYLTYSLRPTTCPKVVLLKNCWTQSEFWVRTTPDKKLEIWIGAGPLYFKAKALGQEPVPGYVYAVHLEEEQENGILNYYWPAPVKKKKQNKNKIKINA